MKVKVRYFASARELASASQETLTLSEGSSVADLVSRIGALHPSLSKMGSSMKFSVNLNVADLGVTLNDGDEVGVLPPVAGG